tara:strand:- start:36 stop:647 length:612 start_codon:yes stop_codon:yes gene_type:complete
MNEVKEIKMYSDFKSPYAWIAFDPAYELEKKFGVQIKWKPFQLRIKGKGQRSVYSEFKVKYSYMDVRRNANLQDKNYMIRGPLKIYDTAPALIGGLFAEREGRLLDYCRFVFSEFFKRELEIDQIEVVSAVIEGLGMSSEAYRDYLNNEGAADYESCLEEAMEDQVFGVPMFIFEGEQFWGHDRIWLIEKRLEQSFKSDVSHA